MLGQFDLVGIPPAPRGVPQIEVTFDIDANGIVQVTAKDKATNKEQQIRIQASGGLSDADIDKMVKDAEANAAADKAKRDLVEARNQADALIYQTEKTLTELGDKAAASDKEAIEHALTELKAALSSENAEDVKAKSQALTEVSMKLGEAMYKAQQEQAAAGGGAEAAGGEQAGDDKVVDADFTEVKEDDRKAG
jgi:molecular chaperone DnaK